MQRKQRVYGGNSKLAEVTRSILIFKRCTGSRCCSTRELNNYHRRIFGRSRGGFAESCVRGRQQSINEYDSVRKLIINQKCLSLLFFFFFFILCSRETLKNIKVTSRLLPRYSILKYIILFGTGVGWGVKDFLEMRCLDIIKTFLPWWCAGVNVGLRHRSRSNNCIFFSSLLSPDDLFF